MMDNFGIPIDSGYEQFEAGIKKSIKHAIFPWKMKVQVLETNSDFQLLRESIKQQSLTPPPVKKQQEETVKKEIATPTRSEIPVEESGDKTAEEPVKETIKVRTLDIFDSVLEILKRHSDLYHLYITPNIPRRKKMNAQQKCEIPAKEMIIGIIDLTIWGSGKECLVFGKKGIYFYNTFAGRGFIAYEVLGELDFSLKDRYRVKLGSKHSLGAGVLLQEGRRELIEILNSIKSVLKK